MPTLLDILTLARIIVDELPQTGLRQEILSRYGIIYALMLLTDNGHAPPIISGFRSLEEQHELNHKWERGETTNKPARFSWHTEGLAIDVFDRWPKFDVFKDLWVLFGGRWGGRFGRPDKPHFDFPITGIKPKPAF